MKNRRILSPVNWTSMFKAPPIPRSFTLYFPASAPNLLETLKVCFDEQEIGRDVVTKEYQHVRGRGCCVSGRRLQQLPETRSLLYLFVVVFFFLPFALCGASASLGTSIISSTTLEGSIIQRHTGMFMIKIILREINQRQEIYFSRSDHDLVPLSPSYKPVVQEQPVEERTVRTGVLTPW